MMAPHWLDEVFDDAAKASAKFSASPKLTAAFALAVERFMETSEFLKNNPCVIGASPQQAARQAFLEHLDLQVV